MFYKAVTTFKIYGQSLEAAFLHNSLWFVPMYDTVI